MPDTPNSASSLARRLALPAVVLLALVALTAFLFIGRQDGGQVQAQAGSAQDPAADTAASSGSSEPQGEADMPGTDASEEEILSALEGLARRQQDDPLALGAVDAPVVMIAYSEFQCPFCGRYARETQPELVERYVADGLLRIEWRDFPYLGPESRTAALAARAAGAQDRFWEFEDAMFADQQPPNSGRLTPEFLADVAEGAGLDRDRFVRDMQSEELASAVEADFQEGQSIGVTGTPAFLVNGRPVIGAQPTDVFVQAVEDALAEAGADR